MQNSSFIDFADISVGTSLSHTTDLDMYMWNEVEKVKDPLKWQNDNHHVYPTLYHMALDYLSIPGKSLFVTTTK